MPQFYTVKINYIYPLRKGLSHITQQNEPSRLQSKADRLWNKVNGISTAKESPGSVLDEQESYTGKKIEGHSNYWSVK